MEVKRRLFMEPSTRRWEAKAVLNPTVILHKGVEHMFYRAIDVNGLSSIGHAVIVDGKPLREGQPAIKPVKDFEARGAEDPRITKIGNTFYLLYTAFDGTNARIAYATSKNLEDWKKQGVISADVPLKTAKKIVKIKKYRDAWNRQEISRKACLWDKDGVLFPEKINGNFAMLHRFLPDIQVVKFKKFEDLQKRDFWEKYIQNLSEIDEVSMYQRYDWESEHIGAGATPIKTKQGWLIIYHGVERIHQGNFAESYDKTMYNVKGWFGMLRNKHRHLIYRAGVGLLDLKHPENEITRLEKPLFWPEHDWETSGDINNVVFPEGAIQEGNKLKIYYGCSDSRIGVAELNFNELMRELKRSSK